jgi:cytochrome c peroxidase
MMLPADLALTQDPGFRAVAREFASDQQAFFTEFARAFQRLQELGM